MEPLVIKLGGVLLDSEEALGRLFTALAAYRASNDRRIVIVHGGGCVVDELMAKLQLPVVKNRAAGHPADQIDIITGRWRAVPTKHCWRGRPVMAQRYRLVSRGWSECQSHTTKVTNWAMSVKRHRTARLC